MHFLLLKSVNPVYRKPPICRKRIPSPFSLHGGKAMSFAIMAALDAGVLEKILFEK